MMLSWVVGRTPLQIDAALVMGMLCTVVVPSWSRRWKSSDTEATCVTMTFPQSIGLVGHDRVAPYYES